jgi:hypothetical protein
MICDSRFDRGSQTEALARTNEVVVHIVNSDGLNVILGMAPLWHPSRGRQGPEISNCTTFDSGLPLPKVPVPQWRWDGWELQARAGRIH